MLLFSQEQTWMKKGTDLFDVSTRAYDGAEVCELIGVFSLTLLGRQCDTKSIGLYRVNCQFLRTVVVRKWKRLRNVYKKYLRTMVWT